MIRIPHQEEKDMNKLFHIKVQVKITKIYACLILVHRIIS
jgi:hypothetical protein